MSENLRAHNRRSLRLRGFDYATPGWYFITLNVRGDENPLCAITHGRVCLNTRGEIVTACWNYLPLLFANVRINEFVIMPDHVHGIIVLTSGKESGCRDLINQIPTTKENPSWILMKNPNVTLGHVVRTFKARATRLIHQAGYGGFEWQSNYYERIIHNQKSLGAIRAYIRSNPVR